MSQNEKLASPRQSALFNNLRRFVKQQEQEPQERCEVCGVGLAEEHPHLFEPVNRQLICTCAECAVSVGQQAQSIYRRVPQRVRALPDFRLSDSRWDSLLIPVGMAFFFYNTPANKVLAFYPSPAGATESLLSLETWEELVQDNPVLKEMEPDVEALLVNRLKGAHEYYLVPVDRCYELVGLIRLYWKGLSGGSQVWEEIERFYASLKAQAHAQ